jgi:hypothetical protein
MIGAVQTLWSVAFYNESGRFWQTAGEGPKAWALGRRAYLLGHSPRLAVRMRRVRRYVSGVAS